jgi:cation transport regulator ChaC
VAVDKAELFDIRRRAFTESDQHVVQQRVAGAAADLRDGGMKNGVHKRLPGNHAIDK